MNTIPNQSKTARRPRNEAGSPPPAHVTIEHNYDLLGGHAPVVEHMTVPAFLRNVDYQWSPNDVRRFGDKVGQMAEALHLAFNQSIDASLGVLRSFPVPLMKRIYNVERTQFGWPALPDGEGAADEAQKLRAEIKKTERAIEQFDEVVSRTEDVTVLEAMKTARARMEEDLRRLQAQAAAPAALPRQ